ncbi:hypothetical protein D3C79_714200 [compost metagenome]
MQAIDAAATVQTPGQGLVIEHGAEAGMQAEQRRVRRDRGVEQQQWIEVAFLALVTGQLGDGRLAHQVAQFELQAQLRLAAHFGKHLENTQGITTQLEEVVGHADLFKL